MIKNGPKTNEPAIMGLNDIYNLLRSSDNKNKTFEELKQQNFNINYQNEFGITVLHHAVINQDLATVKFLHQTAKADSNVRDNDGLTPLHYAVINKDLETVKFLLYTAKADSNIRDNSGSTPLHHASRVNREIPLSIFEHLLIVGSDVNAVNNEGKTPLHIAFEVKNIEAMKSLFIVGKIPIQENLRMDTSNLPEIDFLKVIEKFLESNPPVPPKIKLDKIMEGVETKIETETEIIIPYNYTEIAGDAIQRAIEIATGQHETIRRLPEDSSKPNENDVFIRNFSMPGDDKRIKDVSSERNMGRRNGMKIEPEPEDDGPDSVRRIKSYPSEIKHRMKQKAINLRELAQDNSKKGCSIL